MSNSVQYAKEWMRDGDQLLDRAQQRLTAFNATHESIHFEMAQHDFARAAQMYLTGAIEYQKGRDAVVGATAGFQEAAVLVQHLDGRLRAEANNAWQSVRHEQRSNAREGGQPIDPARTFAEHLRDRLAHAVPELFDRGGSRTLSHDRGLSRTR
jgi:hypothetical protein